MDAVPIYNVNPGAGSCFNGWEAMALLNNGNNRNYGWCDGGWWWILLLFGFFGWGGGWGGGYGRGGCGTCCNSGLGALGADLAITDATNIAEIKAGLNYTAQTQVGQTNLMGQIKDNMFQGFANLNNAVTTAAYQTARSPGADCVLLLQHSGKHRGGEQQHHAAVRPAELQQRNADLRSQTGNCGRRRGDSCAHQRAVYPEP